MSFHINVAARNFLYCINLTEATEYLGIKLTPVSEQGNNAIKGTQLIDKDAYRLRIDGMVERPANLTYDQITNYTPVSKSFP